MEKRRTKKQIRKAKYNEYKAVSCLVGRARDIWMVIKTDPTKLTKINPSWTSFSKFVSWCIIKYLSRIPTAKQREEILIDHITMLRKKLTDIVAELNREIMFFENELRDHRDNNKGELGILKRP